jgi:hypothetical protein
MTTARRTRSTRVITPEIIQDRHREVDPELSEFGDVDIAQLCNPKKQIFCSAVCRHRTRKAVNYTNHVIRAGVITAISEPVTGNTATDPCKVSNVIVRSSD